MKQINLEKINKLIEEKKIDEAHIEISKLGQEYYRNAEYLYLRSKIFYIKKLYYIAIDTLLISLEFERKEKVYNLIAKIYDVLGNKDLSNRIKDSSLRVKTINSLKNELSGIYKE